MNSWFWIPSIDLQSRYEIYAVIDTSDRNYLIKSFHLQLKWSFIKRDIFETSKLTCF